MKTFACGILQHSSFLDFVESCNQNVSVVVGYRAVFQCYLFSNFVFYENDMEMSKNEIWCICTAE